MGLADFEGVHKTADCISEFIQTAGVQNLSMPQLFEIAGQFSSRFLTCDTCHEAIWFSEMGIKLDLIQTRRAAVAQAIVLGVIRRRRAIPILWCGLGLGPGRAFF